MAEGQSGVCHVNTLIGRKQRGIEKVLEILNLTDKYPMKLSRDNLYQITNASLSDDLPTTQKDLAYHFLRRIMRYDSSARDTRCLSTASRSASAETSANTTTTGFSQRIKQRSQQREGTAIAPLDILIAVFLCCDHICRQDLVSHMWSCQLAFPFIIQECPSDPPACFVWPLRSLSVRWETLSDTHEGLLIRVPLHLIAFVRVGDVSLSKSALINDVISDSQKVHPVFFHRDAPGSTKVRYLVNGYIDTSYYFPSGKNGDAFKDALMVLNVHGDASHLKEHCQIISKIASVITVISTIQSLHHIRLVIEQFLKNGNSICIILIDNELNDNDYEQIDSLSHMVGAEKDKFDILAVLDMKRADLITETRSTLQAMMKQNDCLENIISHLTNVKIDEHTEIFIENKKRIKNVVDILKERTCETRKHQFLPLQMGPMKEWAIADKDLVKAGCTRQGEDLDKYRASIMRKQKQYLQQARQIINSNKMKLISNFLSDIRAIHSKSSSQLFLRFLKIELDDLSRREISPLYKDYQHLINNLSGCDEVARERINQEFEKLDERISIYGFGLEHILREIGYVYIATSLDSHSQYSDLPDLAAEILLDGFPFEIMDGDVNSVPVTWVKEVFKRLQQRILKNSGKSDVHIGILSTLGVQSSGKSTMLNVLFGCQFAVSAGRCTRGVYSQIIKADVMSDSGFPLDYILAVDTEGLRAPELSSKGQMISHDNELSTFVIGLGNKTIINLMGENTTYLEELLPISVHAFLRMEEATRLHPSCLIVHHNVEKKNREKLLQQNSSLEKMLDKLTCVASRIQGINVKHFKDVINFNIDSDVHYIPALLDGSHPMAPISRSYSEELSVLRIRLVRHEVDKTRITLSAFIDHLDRLWKAIKCDDFVYQFRHMIDLEARGKFDDFWCDTHWKIRNSVENHLSVAYTLIQNCRSKSETEKTLLMLKESVKTVIANTCDYHAEEFANFIKSVDTLYSEPMKNWNFDMMKRLNDLREDLDKECVKKLNDLKRDNEREMLLKEQESTYREEMINCIKDFVKSQKPSQGSSTELQDNFDPLFQKLWDSMVDKIVTKYPRQSTPIDFISEISAVILTVFPKGRKDLKTFSEEKNLMEYDINNFVPSELKENVFVKLFGSSNEQQIQALSSESFESVKIRMSFIQKYTRPYDRAYLTDIAMTVKTEIGKRSKDIRVTPKTEVYLAISACGYAAKILKQVHKKYEDDHHPRTVMENEKDYYKRIFKVLFTKVESAHFLALDCVEILKRGIIVKLSRELPDKILKNIQSGPHGPVFTLRSKLQLNLLVEIAEAQSFDRFLTFILTPGRSIRKWMSDHVESYNDAAKNADTLKQMYKDTLTKIVKDVESALKDNYPTNCNFISWLKLFGDKLQRIIVLENLHRLEFAKDEDIKLNDFIDLVVNILSVQHTEMEQDMGSFLEENFSNFRDEVVETNLKSVIGCTESCPFCGAMCMVAHGEHAGCHMTTLHRPQGVKGVRDFKSKMLVTCACSEAVNSDNMMFCVNKSDPKLTDFTMYKEYKKIYPQWEITPDVTGEETRFWNWFFAQHVNQLAKVFKALPPVIPLSWKELDRKMEIQNLKSRKET